MENQCWIVGGNEASMSAVYFSRTHSSPTGDKPWKEGWMMENRIRYSMHMAWWRNSNEWVKMMQAALGMTLNRH